MNKEFKSLPAAYLPQTSLLLHLEESFCRILAADCINAAKLIKKESSCRILAAD